MLFCSTTFQFRELQDDIRSGQIDLALTRPCPVWIVRIGEGAGQYLARMLLLITPCLALTAFMAGEFRLGAGRPARHVRKRCCSPGSFCCAPISWLGRPACGSKQAEPVFWIWQKSLFVLGALLWPLTLYPLALARLVWLTPFPAVLAAPAQWAQSTSALGLAAATLHQIVWAAAFIFAAARINRAVLRALQQGGPQ